MLSNDLYLGIQIQGQVLRRNCRFMGEYNLLQVYFIGIESDKINSRSELYNRTKEEIIREFQRKLKWPFPIEECVRHRKWISLQLL